MHLIFTEGNLYTDYKKIIKLNGKEELYYSSNASR